jgi:hypothetical protein
MSQIFTEHERVAQILNLPFQERLARMCDMLARSYAQGWLNHEKYVMGSLTITETSNPYLSRRQATDG